MNEAAIETEEQIISLFPEQETAVCGGWILKTYARQIWVHPLYRILDGDIDERIRICEKTGKYKAAKCVFRIAEYTNYYLRSRLEDNKYCFKGYATVGELNLTDKVLAGIIKSRQQMHIPKITVIQRKISDFRIGMIELAEADGETVQGMQDSRAIGRMWIDTLFLFDGSLLSGSVLWNILKFAVDNRMKKIRINFAGRDSLPELYEECGFQKSYSCYCYEQQEEKNGFAE